MLSFLKIGQFLKIVGSGDSTSTKDTKESATVNGATTTTTTTTTTFSRISEPTTASSSTLLKELPPNACTDTYLSHVLHVVQSKYRCDGYTSDSTSASATGRSPTNTTATTNVGGINESEWSPHPNTASICMFLSLLRSKPNAPPPTITRGGIGASLPPPLPPPRSRNNSSPDHEASDDAGRLGDAETPHACPVSCSPAPVPRPFECSGYNDFWMSIDLEALQKDRADMIDAIDVCLQEIPEPAAPPPPPPPPPIVQVKTMTTGAIAAAAASTGIGAAMANTMDEASVTSTVTALRSSTELEGMPGEENMPPTTSPTTTGTPPSPRTRKFDLLHWRMLLLEVVEVLIAIDTTMYVECFHRAKMQVSSSAGATRTPSAPKDPTASPITAPNTAPMMNGGGQTSAAKPVLRSPTTAMTSNHSAASSVTSRRSKKDAPATTGVKLEGGASASTALVKDASAAEFNKTVEELLNTACSIATWVMLRSVLQHQIAASLPISTTTPTHDIGKNTALVPSVLSSAPPRTALDTCGASAASSIPTDYPLINWSEVVAELQKIFCQDHEYMAECILCAALLRDDGRELMHCFIQEPQSKEVLHSALAFTYKKPVHDAHAHAHHSEVRPRAATDGTLPRDAVGASTSSSRPSAAAGPNTTAGPTSLSAAAPTPSTPLSNANTINAGNSSPGNNSTISTNVSRAPLSPTRKPAASSALSSTGTAGSTSSSTPDAVESLCGTSVDDLNEQVENRYQRYIANSWSQYLEDVLLLSPLELDAHNFPPRSESPPNLVLGASDQTNYPTDNRHNNGTTTDNTTHTNPHSNLPPPPQVRNPSSRTFCQLATAYFFCSDEWGPEERDARFRMLEQAELRKIAEEKKKLSEFISPLALTSGGALFPRTRSSPSPHSSSQYSLPGMVSVMSPCTDSESSTSGRLGSEKGGGEGRPLHAVVQHPNECAVQTVLGEIETRILNMSWTAALHKKVEHCVAARPPMLEVARSYSEKERAAALIFNDFRAKQRALISSVNAFLAAGLSQEALTTSISHFKNEKREWARSKQTLFSAVRYLQSMVQLVQAQAACQAHQSVIETVQIVIPQADLCDKMLSVLAPHPREAFVLRFSDTRAKVLRSRTYLLQEGWRSHAFMRRDGKDAKYFTDYLHALRQIRTRYREGEVFDARMERGHQLMQRNEYAEAAEHFLDAVKLAKRAEVVNTRALPKKLPSPEHAVVEGSDSSPLTNSSFHRNIHLKVAGSGNLTTEEEHINKDQSDNKELERMWRLAESERLLGLAYVSQAEHEVNVPKRRIELNNAVNYAYAAQTTLQKWQMKGGTPKRMLTAVPSSLIVICKALLLLNQSKKAMLLLEPLIEDKPTSSSIRPPMWGEILQPTPEPLTAEDIVLRMDVNSVTIEVYQLYTQCIVQFDEEKALRAVSQVRNLLIEGDRWIQTVGRLIQEPDLSSPQQAEPQPTMMSSSPMPNTTMPAPMALDGGEDDSARLMDGQHPTRYPSEDLGDRTDVGIEDCETAMMEEEEVDNRSSCCTSRKSFEETIQVVLHSGSERLRALGALKRGSWEICRALRDIEIATGDAYCKLKRWDEAVSTYESLLHILQDKTANGAGTATTTSTTTTTTTAAAGAPSPPYRASTGPPPRSSSPTSSAAAAVAADISSAAGSYPPALPGPRGNDNGAGSAGGEGDYSYVTLFGLSPAWRALLYSGVTEQDSEVYSPPTENPEGYMLPELAENRAENDLGHIAPSPSQDLVVAMVAEERADHHAAMNLIYSKLAVVYQAVGNLQTSIRYHKLVLAYSNGIKDESLQYKSLLHLARLYTSTNAQPEGQETWERVSALAKEYEDQEVCRETMRNILNAKQAAGKYFEVVQSAEALNELAKTAEGAVSDRRFALETLANAHLQLGQFDDCLSALDERETVQEHSGEWNGKMYEMRAKARIGKGQSAEAIKVLTAWVQKAKQLKKFEEIGKANSSLANAYAADHNEIRAQRRHIESITAFSQLPSLASAEHRSTILSSARWLVHYFYLSNELVELEPFSQQQHKKKNAAGGSGKDQQSTSGSHSGRASSSAAPTLENKSGNLKVLLNEEERRREGLPSLLKGSIDLEEGNVYGGGAGGSLSRDHTLLPGDLLCEDEGSGTGTNSESGVTSSSTKSREPGPGVEKKTTGGGGGGPTRSVGSLGNVSMCNRPAAAAAGTDVLETAASAEEAARHSDGLLSSTGSTNPTTENSATTTAGGAGGSKEARMSFLSEHEHDDEPLDERITVSTRSCQGAIEVMEWCTQLLVQRSRYTATPSPYTPAEAVDLAMMAHPNCTFIFFFAEFTTSSGSGSYDIIVRPARSSFFISKSAQVTSVNPFKDAASNILCDGEDTTQFDAELEQQLGFLYEELWLPVDGALKSAKSRLDQADCVFVVPDASLYNVPFTALVPGTMGGMGGSPDGRKKSKKAVSPLGAQSTMVITPSLTHLVHRGMAKDGPMKSFLTEAQYGKHIILSDVGATVPFSPHPPPPATAGATTNLTKPVTKTPDGEEVISVVKRTLFGRRAPTSGGATGAAAAAAISPTATSPGLYSSTTTNASTSSPGAETSAAAPVSSIPDNEPFKAFASRHWTIQPACTKQGFIEMFRDKSTKFFVLGCPTATSGVKVSDGAVSCEDIITHSSHSLSKKAPSYNCRHLELAVLQNNQNHRSTEDQPGFAMKLCLYAHCARALRVEDIFGRAMDKPHREVVSRYMENLEKVFKYGMDYPYALALRMTIKDAWEGGLPINVWGSLTLVGAP